jgi:hypothetical protein
MLQSVKINRFTGFFLELAERVGKELSGYRRQQVLNSETLAYRHEASHGAKAAHDSRF